MRINPTDTQCKFTDDIPNFKNNALTKIWIQESVHLSNNEEGMLEGLQTSPIAFGLHISENLFSYSGGKAYGAWLCSHEL